ncbi:MAG: alpha-N-arabinofuranosidase [Opitutaceae bacterium]|nr:alpha-N-arabinofuranosidase [Opitutaceae bacterium]
MNKLMINAAVEQGTIDRHVYGHFAEHLGSCIYGGIWVGEDSEIPNVRGIRKDVVAALRAIRIPNLRWPGGCFADEYHWEDGIGPREKRPTMINTHWGGVTENNHFGTHEFMDLCAQLGCEPYICGNVGSGTVREMQQWVEYIASDSISPMTNLRKENGREEPWSLKFWGVGNENWCCGGCMRPEYYADEFRRYQTYVRNFGDNEIYKIACGPNEADYEWTETLMKNTLSFQKDQHLMKGLSLHYYTNYRQSATEFDESAWFEVLQKTLVMDELITRHSAIMDKYDPEKKVALIIDEWGTWYNAEPDTNPRFLYQQNSLRDALVAALNFHIFHEHNERVRMTNIAQTINVLQAMILTEDEKMVLTPTYHVFEMFKVHQGATRISLNLESNDYTFGESSMPQVSASASRDSEGKVHLTLSNTNPSDSADISCDLLGLEVSSVSGRVLTAEQMTAHNTFEKPDQVRPVDFEGARLDGSNLSIVMPAMSVVVLELV